MNSTATETFSCSVCHRMLTPSESYLLQGRAGRVTAVHRHLCFPPPAGAAALSDRALARVA